jgi:hypothetical protein
MPKTKTHPEDLMLAELIASATEFTAHIRLAPHDKTTLRGFPSYEAARAAADKLETTSRFGRGAMVYAVTPKGWTIPCDPKLVGLGGKP